MVDPAYSEKLRDSLAGLADHAFFVRQKAPDGHEPGMPVYTYSLPPPPVKIDDARMMQIIAESKEKYGIKPSDIEDDTGIRADTWRYWEVESNLCTKITV